MAFSKRNIGLQLSGILMLFPMMHYSYAYTCPTSLSSETCEAQDLKVTINITKSTCVAPWTGERLYLGDNLQPQKKGSVLASKKTRTIDFYNCEDTGMTRVKAYFVDAGGEQTDPTYFRNLGSATGVGIKLTDIQTGEQIIPYKGIMYNMVDGSASLDVNAELIQTATTATTGSLLSHITVELMYE